MSNYSCRCFWYRAVLVIGFSSVYGLCQNTITVNNRARPLAGAADMLEREYGVLINYEDPPYTFPGDLAEISASGSIAQKTPSRPILVPRRGSLTMSTSISHTRTKVGPEGARELITNLLAAYETSGNPGVFAFSQDGDVFTILPTASKDRNGALVATTLVLDTRITIEEQSVTAAQAVEIVCLKTNEASRLQQMELGVIPINMLVQSTMQLSASNEPARSVLARILGTAQKGRLPAVNRRLVWRLYYTPDKDRYILNIQIAKQRMPGPTGNSPNRVVPIQ